MKRKMVSALLLVGALVISAWLVYEYAVVMVLLGWLKLGWNALVALSMQLGRTILFRRLSRPIWKAIGWFAVTGYFSWRFRQAYTRHADALWREARHRWLTLPPFVRTLLVLGVVLAIAAFGFGLLLFPLALPLVSFAFRKLRVWCFDTWLERWSRPLRRKVHRYVRGYRHEWWAQVLRAVRHYRLRRDRKLRAKIHSAVERAQAYARKRKELAKQFARTTKAQS